MAEGVVHRLVKTIAAAAIVCLVAYLMANPVRSLFSNSFGLGLGLDFEVVKRYPMGDQEVMICREDAGATTSFASSFHIVTAGDEPTVANRVLVIPNDPDDLTVSPSGSNFDVNVNGQNTLNLPLCQTFDGASFRLSFHSD